MRVGSILIYPAGHSDRIVGHDELAGIAIVLLEPVSGVQKRDSWKSKKYVQEMLDRGEWKIELAPRERVRL